jgi:hypothetical protein
MCLTSSREVADSLTSIGCQLSSHFCLTELLLQFCIIASFVSMADDTPTIPPPLTEERVRQMIVTMSTEAASSSNSSVETLQNRLDDLTAVTRFERSFPKASADAAWLFQQEGEVLLCCGG